MSAEDYIGDFDSLFNGQYDREPINNDSIWTTRDGKRISIREMGDAHLLNTIRVLRGKSPIGTTFKTDNITRREWLNAMANEAYSRGLSLDETDAKDPVHE